MNIRERMQRALDEGVELYVQDGTEKEMAEHLRRLFLQHDPELGDSLNVVVDIIHDEGVPVYVEIDGVNVNEIAKELLEQEDDQQIVYLYDEARCTKKYEVEPLYTGYSWVWASY